MRVGCLFDKGDVRKGSGAEKGDVRVGLGDDKGDVRLGFGDDKGGLPVSFGDDKDLAHKESCSRVVPTSATGGGRRIAIERGCG